MRPEFSNVYILKTYNAVSGVLCILQADISAMRIITLAHSLYRYFFNEKKKNGGKMSSASKAPAKMSNVQ